MLFLVSGFTTWLKTYACAFCFWSTEYICIQRGTAHKEILSPPLQPLYTWVIRTVCWEVRDVDSNSRKQRKELDLGLHILGLNTEILCTVDLHQIPKLTWAWCFVANLILMVKGK